MLEETITVVKTVIFSPRENARKESNQMHSMWVERLLFHPLIYIDTDQIDTKEFDLCGNTGKFLNIHLNFWLVTEYNLYSLKNLLNTIFNTEDLTLCAHTL